MYGSIVGLMKGDARSSDSSPCSPTSPNPKRTSWGKSSRAPCLPTKQRKPVSRIIIAFLTLFLGVGRGPGKSIGTKILAGAGLRFQ